MEENNALDLRRGGQSFCKDYCWHESKGHKRKRQQAEAAHESKPLIQQVYNPDSIKGNTIIYFYPLLVFAKCWRVYLQ